jgi:UDP-GlcNAc:undecaprenyl-phosphate/decaprenyl-phosphate GlcNAc-1-phosphate transferase
MGWVALAVSLGVALFVVPAGVRTMDAAGLVRENYRGRRVAFPLGAVLVAASLLALAPLAPLDDRADLDFLDPELRRWFLYVIGVAFLGLMDDALGRGAEAETPRGWRGHARAVMSGELSTGVVKAVGAFALAAYAVSGLGREALDYLVDLALLLLATNLANLLDLRPGRAEKALALTGLALCLAYWTVEPIELLGLFLGPVAVGAWFTLRERAMLGDTGSNVIGALIGIWLVTTLSDPGRYVALGVLVALTVYGEFRSISAAIERVPLLKQLDSLGRAR